MWQVHKIKGSKKITFTKARMPQGFFGSPLVSILTSSKFRLQVKILLLFSPHIFGLTYAKSTNIEVCLPTPRIPELISRWFRTSVFLMCWKFRRPSRCNLKVTQSTPRLWIHSYLAICGWVWKEIAKSLNFTKSQKTGVRKEPETLKYSVL